MSQLLITLTDESKLATLQSFLQTIDYVVSVEEVKPHTVEESPYNDSEEADENRLYEPKHTYSIQDLESIVAQFPANHCWTYRDLKAYFPADLAIKVEIIKNQLFIMPSPEQIHQDIVGDLFIAFKVFAKTHRLGSVIISPFDVVLDENNVLIPDILYVSVQRSEILDGKKVNGAPDLLVEVWSPSNKKKERLKKHQLYAEKGVAEFWQIFPKKKYIIIETLNAAGEYELFSEAKKEGTVRSKVLEGFALNLNEIFS
ncbi:MAG: Uma2 family endonuclease [Saprospiraceae bacterium]|nr:Uma2 family endonuclease [Saprospiraceae bacterium]